jgi:uncharacterized membrane protein YsdA (DUF1294 family)
MFLYYTAFLSVMSLVAFFLYAADKKKAKKGKWRIPEATLLGVGFCGGAVGALLAMNGFRHKTKHWYFWVINVLGLLVQGVIAVWIIKFL